jgi:hypothetical protein
VNWASMGKVLLGSMGDRVTERVRTEIDEEFEFHIEERARELMERGMPSEAARAAALEAFGDVAGFRGECFAIAMKERIMLQRVNAVLTAVLLVGLGLVAYQSYAGQRRVADSLASIAGVLAEVRGTVVQVHEYQDLAAKDRKKYAEGGGIAYLQGKALRPGTYALPNPGQITVRRLLASAGGLAADAIGRVKVVRVADGRNEVIAEFSPEEIRDPNFSRDLPLKSGDMVSVE